MSPLTLLLLIEVFYLLFNSYYFYLYYQEAELLKDLLPVAGPIGGRMFFDVLDGHHYKLKSARQIVCADSSIILDGYLHDPECEFWERPERPAACHKVSRGHIGHSIAELDAVLLNLFYWLIRILQSRNPLITEGELLDECLVEWPLEFTFNPAYVIHRRVYARAGAQRRYAVPERVEGDGLVGENGLQLFRAAMGFFETHRDRIQYWTLPPHRKLYSVFVFMGVYSLFVLKRLFINYCLFLFCLSIFCRGTHS